MTNIVHVAVAVIVNVDNKVCISLRHKNTHQGGLWEFPGGKVEQGETVDQTLKREIKEELNLSIESSRHLIKFIYNYPDVTVCLHVRKVQSYSGHATGLEGQELKWVRVSQLPEFDFPAANASIISALQLPEKYLITGRFVDQNEYIYKLKKALANNIRLVQLRLKNDHLNQLENPQRLIEDASVICKQAGAELMLNLSEAFTLAIDLSDIEFSGFHADSLSLMKFSKRPEGKLFAASCHNESELEKALQLSADFVVVSPVQKTLSHPEADAMGWDSFSKLIDKTPTPVYALGGLSEADLITAWGHGAQGIAAISAFWQE